MPPGWAAAVAAVLLLLTASNDRSSVCSAATSVRAGRDLHTAGPEEHTRVFGAAAQHDKDDDQGASASALLSGSLPGTTFAEVCGEGPDGVEAAAAILKARADANGNIVIAASDGGGGGGGGGGRSESDRPSDPSAFAELSAWFVADLERTGTPYLFVARDEAQCERVHAMIAEAMDPRSAFQTRRGMRMGPVRSVNRLLQRRRAERLHRRMQALTRLEPPGGPDDDLRDHYHDRDRDRRPDTFFKPSHHRRGLLAEVRAAAPAQVHYGGGARLRGGSGGRSSESFGSPGSRLAAMRRARAERYDRMKTRRMEKLAREIGYEAEAIRSESDHHSALGGRKLLRAATTSYLNADEWRSAANAEEEERKAREATFLPARASGGLRMGPTGGGSQADWRATWGNVSHANSPGQDAARCAVCGARVATRLPDHMFLMRARYKVLLNVIKAGFNGLVADLDVVFRSNPFDALDQLGDYDVVSWMEGTPIQANGGLNFARGRVPAPHRDGVRAGERRGGAGGGRGVVEWMLSEFDRRQKRVLNGLELDMYSPDRGGAFHPDLSPREIRRAIQTTGKGYKPGGLAQHCTDDQDVWQDVIDSAVRGEIIDRKQWRSLRIIVEHALAFPNETEAEAGEAAVQAHSHSGYDDLAAYKPDIVPLTRRPALWRYATERFHCASAEPEDAQLRSLNISDGVSQGRFLWAPNWLLRGPVMECGGQAVDRSTPLGAVTHCFGKQPECLYPPEWRPGAMPNGRPDWVKPEYESRL